jgi:hypothetical protein
MVMLSRPVWSALASQAERNVDGISDNSFFIEEAYNQEPGVVQHIFNAVYGSELQSGQDDEAWILTFTQEWPVFSQKHQLSYTLPYIHTDGPGSSVSGIGDMLLNYRYQVYFDEDSLSAFAPRFSLALPTGDDDRGAGEGTLGYQVNLPFSTTFGDKTFLHLNAGSTFLPNATSSNDRDLWHYNVGASGIYAVTPDVHLMLEWVGLWIEAPQSGGSLHHEFESVISPGIRKAFNLNGDLQIVVGAAVPVGLTDTAPDIGAFLYLSIEHPFRKAK